MADTGAPWNLPYPLPTDLVRDGAQAIQDLAEATADGLDAAGGLVAVKHVLKTNTFTASSIAAGANVAVDDLSITHEVADENNRLIITAYFGAAASTDGANRVGIAVAQDGTLIGVGTGVGSRTAVGAGGAVQGTSVTNSNLVVSMPSVTFVHTPGAGEKTYTVRVINSRDTTETLYVNRAERDDDLVFSARAASALVIQEVKV